MTSTNTFFPLCEDWHNEYSQEVQMLEARLLTDNPLTDNSPTGQTLGQAIAQAIARKAY